MYRLGQEFLLQLLHPTDGWIGAWCPRSNDISINSEQIDTTCSSNAYHRLIAGGIRSADINSAGMFDSTAQTSWIMQQAFNGAMIQWRVISGAAQESMSGQGIITSVERSGEYQDAAVFTLGITSSGPVQLDSSATDNILDHNGADILDHLGQPIEVA